MPRYLISFDDGAMDHIPDADWPAVGDAAHAWAARIADACRCPQEVREIIYDPES
jgi:hypothetical protein